MVSPEGSSSSPRFTGNTVRRRAQCILCTSEQRSQTKEGHVCCQPDNELVAVMRLEPVWSDRQATTSPAVLHWYPCCCDIWGHPHSHSPWPISLPLACKVNKHLQHISGIHLEVPPIFNLAAFAEQLWLFKMRWYLLGWCHPVQARSSHLQAWKLSHWFPHHWSRLRELTCANKVLRKPM